jgi:hypothetical protein
VFTRTKAPRKFYCSTACRARLHTRVCEHCATEFSVKLNSAQRFCSKRCYGTAISGAASPLSVFESVDYGSGWKAAREAALQRDAGTCQDCGYQRGNGITVHHVTPYEAFRVNLATTAREKARRQRLAHTLSNLVSLCRACHNVRHTAIAARALTEYWDRHPPEGL